MTTRHCVLLLLIVIFLPAYSQENTAFRNEFGFRSDNDSFLGIGQDRYYTNGLFITFRHAADQSRLSGKLQKKIWEIEAGHMIFNPYTGQVSDLREIDRPFAAYLYTGGALNWHFRRERSLRAALQIGMIGPSARGRQVQETLHDLIGFYEIRGWEFQVRDETGMNGSLGYTQLLARSGGGRADLSLSTEGRIGNTFTGASAGVIFRAGSISPLHSTVYNNSRLANNAAEDAPKNEFFFFMEPSLNFVAYDATIQGGMFRADKGPVTFDVKPVVFSHEMGGMYGNDRWTFQFSLTFLTREVQSPARAQQYGTARIYYRFSK